MPGTLSWLLNNFFTPAAHPSIPAASAATSAAPAPPLPSPSSAAAVSLEANNRSSPSGPTLTVQGSPLLQGRTRTISTGSTTSSVEDAEGTASGEAIVVGVDSTPPSINALNHALVHSRPGDTVHVCYCYAPLQDYVCPEFSKTHDDNEALQWQRRQQCLFETFMKSNPFQAPEGVNVMTHFVAGDPRDKLPELAESTHASNIVVGAPEHSLLSSLLGSVSADLARNCSRPVTLVPNTPETALVANMPGASLAPLS